MLKEFKEFAMKGNVVDMAVGVIMGGAFGTIITGLVDGIINPIIGALTAGVNLSELAVEVMGVQFQYGLFIDAVIKFLIISFTMFLFVKGINKMSIVPKEEAPAPATKTCPFCKTDIALDATRCPNCTSELNK